MGLVGTGYASCTAACLENIHTTLIMPYSQCADTVASAHMSTQSTFVNMVMHGPCPRRLRASWLPGCAGPERHPYAGSGWWD